MIFPLYPDKVIALFFAYTPVPPAPTDIFPLVRVELPFSITIPTVPEPLWDIFVPFRFTIPVFFPTTDVVLLAVPVIVPPLRLTVDVSPSTSIPTPLLIVIVPDV